MAETEEVTFNVTRVYRAPHFVPQAQEALSALFRTNEGMRCCCVAPRNNGSPGTKRQFLLAPCAARNLQHVRILAWGKLHLHVMPKILVDEDEENDFFSYKYGICAVFLQ